ncbi:MAG TPA: flagellar basal body P-ring protein FlgI [Longimicrobiaceae bacterium]|nr:flagellar basal body P-ring protein FlgI [Longimicrobiaceae bacterium]
MRDDRFEVPSARCRVALLLALALVLVLPRVGRSQVKIRDLTIQEQSVPVRLMGYGLVVGLDGTGDYTMGGRAGGQTVQSVANLLRRFDIEVPPEVLRTRNVAAVLVTAEVSPYLRPGGRFEVHVSSLGDARSIRGGVLWMTPLVSEPGGPALAGAQGSLLVSEGGQDRGGYTVETTARIPAGGVLEAELPRPAFASVSRLMLKQPELGTATRIADAINAALGAGSATVVDPGAVSLKLGGAPDARLAALARIADLPVDPVRTARVIIDGRDGTVVAGGQLSIGEAVVSHGAVTLTVGPGAGGQTAPGEVRMAVGTSAQQIAAALHAVQTPPSDIAAIFESLREVGAMNADVEIR